MLANSMNFVGSLLEGFLVLLEGLLEEFLVLLEGFLVYWILERIGLVCGFDIDFQVTFDILNIIFIGIFVFLQISNMTILGNVGVFIENHPTD